MPPPGSRTERTHDLLTERACVLTALGRIVAGAARVEDEVPRVLRSLPQLDHEGRGRIARAITATAVLRLRLAYQTGSDDPALWLDALERDATVAPPLTREWPSDALERMVVERSCPRFLVDALVRSLGVPGADSFLRASNAPGPKTLRANLLRGSRDDAARVLRDEGIVTSPGAHSPWALHVHGRANLFGSRAWRAGWFEVQDEASQLVALACAPQPGEIVIDLCAGRGGKSLALAAQLTRGTLYLHDVDEAALSDGTPRLARAGVTDLPALRVVRGLPTTRSADVVLVDAPCSSIGVLRRSPDLRFALQPDQLLRHVATQRALLEQGRALLRPGGRLVYATCSVLREENEEVAGAGCTLLPHVEGTDGFFIAA